MKQFTPAERKNIYLSIAESIMLEPYFPGNRIRHQLAKHLRFKPFLTTTAWGIRVTKPFPELMLFATNNHDEQNYAYFYMDENDYQLRQDILLFCAAMI